MMGLPRLVAAAVVLAGQLSGVSAAEVPINTPSPMSEPRYPHCEQFAKPRYREWCSDMAAMYGITREQWDLWNPSHPFNSRACVFHMWTSYWFCVKAKADAPPPPSPAPTIKKPPVPTTYKARKGEVPRGGRRFSQARPQDEPEPEPEPSKPEPKDPEMTKPPAPLEQNQCRFGGP